MFGNLIACCPFSVMRQPVDVNDFVRKGVMVFSTSQAIRIHLREVSL